VVADGFPQPERPTDAPVYTHREVRSLSRIGPKALPWVQLVKQLLGAIGVDGGWRHGLPRSAIMLTRRLAPEKSP
jgi:hypothetical protein